MRRDRIALIVVAVVGILVTSAATSAFVVDVGPTMEEPRSFEDTLIVGVSPSTDVSVADANVSMPKAQAYYSEYRYVLGYHSIQRLLAHQQRPGQREQFGQLAGLFVTDYSSTTLELTPGGYPRVTSTPEWVDGTEAVYVVGSDARSDTNTPILPFSDPDDAKTYVEEYNGSVLSWSEITDRHFDVDDAERVRDRIDTQQERADELARNLSSFEDRPVSTVVDDSDQTIQEAINNAPPGSKIVVSNGTFEEHIRINKSITLIGSENTTIRGDRRGTPITVTVPRAAILDLRITGVGDSIRAEDEDASHALSMAYGGGDAGILIRQAPHTLVRGVEIETPTTGVMVRESHESVIDEVTVSGGENWRDGYMGVLLYASEDCLVEDSSVSKGRDGIYTEHSHGLVYRNNSLSDNRLGVHLMYTSETVIANNTVHHATHTGIHDMTNSRFNSFVNNTVRSSPKGLRTEGWFSYVARNTMVDNEVGMTTEAANSIYENNVLMDNEVGMQGSHILPTNTVSDNDFLRNERHATARRGPLRLWNGNYWEGAIGVRDGKTLDRPYSPTGTVDSRLHRVDGTPTLAFAPVELASDSYPGSLAGLRSSSIIDTTPLREPANPELINRSR